MFNCSTTKHVHVLYHDLSISVVPMSVKKTVKKKSVVLVYCAALTGTCSCDAIHFANNVQITLTPTKGILPFLYQCCQQLTTYQCWQ